MQEAEREAAPSKRRKALNQYKSTTKAGFTSVQRSNCYTVLDMEEEAIITEVRPGTQRSLGEGLDINFLQVSFRLLRRTRYEDHGYKVTLKCPAWLSQLEPSAPLNGYLMEHGEFSAELTKDKRINEDLKVTVEVTDV